MTCMNCGTPLTPAVKFCPRCGTPAAHEAPPPARPYEPPGGQTYTSWDAAREAPRPRRKSRAGKILLIVFGVLVVLGVGAAVAAYYGYRYLESTLKNSEPYRLAVDELKRSAVAAEHLGEIKETGFPLGSFHESAGGTGNAAFTMTVEGTKASGQYVVTMEREGGAWKITRAFLKLADGEVVTIGGSAMEEVGAYEPPGASAGTRRGEAPPPPPKPVTGGTVVSGGVLNGKAISKPAPTYPAIARAARAEGTVTVQVVVDEQGRVISATPVSGHPLLQQAAAAAARQARFSPTLLSGRPVKVSGILTYVFKLE